MASDVQQTKFNTVSSVWGGQMAEISVNKTIHKFFRNPRCIAVCSARDLFKVMVCIIALMGGASSANAQAFVCDTKHFISRESPTPQLYSYDYIGSAFTNVGPSPAISYNGIGYREQDNLLYGVDRFSNHIVSIDAGGTVIDLGFPSGGSFTPNAVAGDVSPAGLLYVAGFAQTTMYVIDVTTATPSITSTVTLAQPLDGGDIVFTPDGKLYIFQMASDTLYEVNPTTGAFTAVTGSIVAMAAVNSSGMMADNANGIYIYDPAGDIWRIDLTTGNETLVKTGVQSASTADAASCRSDPPIGLTTISGNVFEDIAGNALAGGESIHDASNPGLGSVTVNLYNDNNGDGLPDAGDSLAAVAITAADGSYNFVAVNGDYLVVVDSTTLNPANRESGAASYTGGSSVSDVWLEQTYGVSGALVSNGAGGTSTKGSSGAAFGGRRGANSDQIFSNSANVTLAEHVTAVTVSGANVSNVDSGFSANVVTNNLGGDATDDDGTANRTVQGSLRQFIQNANAINGANAMRHVPSVPTNESGSGGSWWTITVSNLFPVISDADTTIDGAAYQLSDGTSTRNTNAGLVGTGGTVGVDGFNA